MEISILNFDYAIELFESIVHKVEVILGCRSRIEILFYLGMRDRNLFTNRIIIFLDLNSLHNIHFSYFQYELTYNNQILADFYVKSTFAAGFYPDAEHIKWLTQAHPWLNKIF